MSTSTEDPLQELLDIFEMLDDWEQRFEHLIALGRQLPPMPAEEHSETNKVRGCMSQVWLAGGVQGTPPRMNLRGDSDAHIVKGLIALILKLTNQRTPREVLATDIGAAFEKLGLESHLSMNRRNGFFAMVERIRAMAAAAEGASGGAA
jgi:cysteine desulfuration protein SufE